MTTMEREAIKEMVRAAVKEALVNAPTALTTAPDQSPSAYFAPWTGVAYQAEPHPSQEQFKLSEATDPRGELLEFVADQDCIIEKNKPCDHCGQCRARGF